MIIRLLLFGMLGLLASLIITVAKKSIVARRLDLNGEASLVLFPLCGLGAILFPLIAMRVSSMPWYGRGAVYMAAFFVVQYLAGLGLSRLNACPWNYSGKGSLGGLIRIADAPLWFGLGLATERAYPFIKAAAVALG